MLNTHHEQILIWKDQVNNNTTLFGRHDYRKSVCNALFPPKPLLLFSYFFPSLAFYIWMNNFEQRGKNLYTASLAAGNISFRNTPNSNTQRLRDSQFTLGSTNDNHNNNNSSFSFHGNVKYKHTMRLLI